MKEFECRCGAMVQVPDSLLDCEIKRAWKCDGKGGGVVWTSEDRGTYFSIKLSHLIMGEPPPGLEWDHKDRNSHNNLKENLRLATRSQNAANRNLQSNNSSGYRGVNFHKLRKRWQASIKVEGTWIYLGMFDTKEAAAREYDKAAKHNFGEFANLNFPEKNPS